MNIQHIQDILFRSSTNEEEALQIKNLCELYISKFWEHTYYQSMANYGHHVWHPHQLDLAMWHRDRNPHFAERGIYSHQVISPGDNVLELCSGDGFYTYYFFSGKASHVDALDIDDNALEHARRHHSSSNIQYYRSNIVLDPFPSKSYDVVVWDSAIRRLKVEEIEIVLSKVIEVLTPTNGVFSCYEIFEDDQCHIPFITDIKKDELIQIFKKYFKTVKWIRTETPGRHNFYFHCFLDERPEYSQ